MIYLGHRRTRGGDILGHPSATATPTSAAPAVTVPDLLAVGEKAAPLLRSIGRAGHQHQSATGGAEVEVHLCPLRQDLIVPV